LAIHRWASAKSAQQVQQVQSFVEPCPVFAEPPHQPLKLADRDLSVARRKIRLRAAPLRGLPIRSPLKLCRSRRNHSHD
jgi:hypothetical protein